MLEKGRKVAIKASKIMNLGVSGVDIMPSKDLKRLYVLELNAFPGFPALKKFDLSKLIFRKLRNYSNNLK